jgi:hypothetical protein
MDLGLQMIKPLNDAFRASTTVIRNTPPRNANIHNENNFDFLDEMELQAIGDVPTNDDDLHPRKDDPYFIMLATKTKVPLYHINQFFRLISTLMILNACAIH